MDSRSFPSTFPPRASNGVLENMLRRLHVATAGLIPLPFWRYKIAATPSVWFFSATF
jgi:hypothetical protein